MIDRALDWIERNYLHATLIVLAVLVAILVSALASVSHAATLAGSFTLPTAYEDGSVLPPANIKHIRVEVGTCTGTAPNLNFSVREGETLVVPPAATFSVTSPRAFGQFCLRAQTETTLGTLSVWTPTASKLIAEPAPKPPQQFTIAMLGYELRQYSNGTLRFVQVGTVPLGAPCGLPLVTGFAAFDGATITKPTTGGVIAARCAPRES